MTGRHILPDHSGHAFDERQWVEARHHLFPNHPVYPTKPAYFCNGSDLANGERVVTHAPMAKNRDSLILGLVLLAVAAFGAFVWTQDADATRRGDYFACWTDSCRKASAADAANRLGGASDVDALPDQL